jgi:hypothetical protein
VLTVPIRPLPSLDSLARELALRLQDAIEAATRERGLALLDALFAKIRARPGLGLGQRAAGRIERERRRVLASLTRQFLRDVERATRERVREELDRQRTARAQARRAARLEAPVRRRARPRPLPPPPDPEQLKRDAEMARLRALLRPTSEDLPAVPPEPPPPAVPPPPATPSEFLRALEKEIQNAVPSLAGLGSERAGAQIAAWTGQVRQLRDRLPPELSALMRPAIRIFLEHLTELRTALDATFVDALEPKWHPPDWGVYIEANRACAEGRAPALTPDQLVAHHRAMLKALVQPHRRHVPDQAGPVIAAAAEVLPPTDGQLRSAIRRHSEPQTRPPHPEPEAVTPASGEALVPEALGDEPFSAPAPETAEVPAGETASPPVDGAPPAEEPTTDAPPPTPAPPPGEGEFDQPWTK